MVKLKIGLTEESMDLLQWAELFYKRSEQLAIVKE